MNHQNYLETINTVLAWDLPDEAFAEAISQQFVYVTYQTGDVNDRDTQLQ